MKNQHLRPRAYVEVKKAKRLGLLTPQPCAAGGGCPRTPTVAHHEDYAKPLDVIWLCRMHHVWRHNGDIDESLKPTWDAA